MLAALKCRSRQVLLLVWLNTSCSGCCSIKPSYTAHTAACMTACSTYTLHSVHRHATGVLAVTMILCPAVGLFPFRTIMDKKKMEMGYIEVQMGQGCTLFPGGCQARGHVFHFSRILQEKVVGGWDHAAGNTQDTAWQTGYHATMQVRLTVKIGLCTPTC